MFKKITYTKIVVTFVCLVFFGTLLFCLQQDIDGYEQLTLYASALTVTGSIMLTTLIFYSKKSMSENLQKIKIEYYKQTMDIRLKYNEKMLKLRSKYGVDEEVIEEIEDESEFDDVSDTAFYEGAERLQESIEDVQSDLERQEVES